MGVHVIDIQGYSCWISPLMSSVSGGLLLSWEVLPKLPIHQFLSCAGQDFHHWKNFTSEPSTVVKDDTVKSPMGTPTLLPNRKLTNNFKFWVVHSDNLLNVVQLDLSR